jgi:hypothetical protein
VFPRGGCGKPDHGDWAALSRPCGSSQSTTPSTHEKVIRKVMRLLLGVEEPKNEQIDAIKKVWLERKNIIVSGRQQALGSPWFLVWITTMSLYLLTREPSLTSLARHAPSELFTPTKKRASHHSRRSKRPRNVF